MIVDASVAVKWLVVEEDSELAQSLLGRIDLTAPTIIHAEVGNAIWKKRRNGELSDDPEFGLLPDLLASILQTVDETTVMEQALRLAVTLDHPIYDCIYLALAIDMDRDLVTADTKFACKSKSAGVGDRVRVLGEAI